MLSLKGLSKTITGIINLHQEQMFEQWHHIILSGTLWYFRHNLMLMWRTKKLAQYSKQSMSVIPVIW